MFSDTEHRIRLDRLEKTAKDICAALTDIRARASQVENTLHTRTRIERFFVRPPGLSAMSGLLQTIGGAESESYDVNEIVELLLSHLGLKLEKVKGPPETARLAPLDTINVRKPKAYKKRVKK